ncbi:MULTISPECIES: acetate/propionate family kinase [unclassified Porphyromonas]|uniref:acetate/propionate family kinase n=1 Tax=unclassified Porphyromonas TaxID=2645799 RepID=UPI00052D46AF|nr:MULTISPECIES: acetate kinase [unclassified Porphyromonas]KGN68559.1 acetate kinase [Porphyromonas sp. COT-108 OH1349]KGN94422.1 acetate kinase [Porphyromonas sp. COT-108 OH2963]
MKILVLNCGSSSVKYKLFNMTSKEVLAEGGVEKLGLPGSFLKFVGKDGKKVILEKDLPEHTAAVEFILSVLKDKEHGCISSYDEIEAVGHRLVHGGEKFSKSVLITDEVIKQVEECIELAPLHNPPNIKGVDAIKALLPKVPQVGVFDTAFHQTMEPFAYMYALPYELYEKYGIRRYGFHGTSHRYVSQRACEVLGLDINKTKIITAHIGNGASIAAIKDGKVMDTSMGLTPTEGLIMGTRCGDVDPGALAFLVEKLGLDGEGLSNLINKKSGVLGVTQISSDMREVEAGIERGDKKAILAMEMYDYRIKKYIGAYAAAMGGVDLLIFTGGVGENQWTTRETVCEGLGFLGLEIDKELNTNMRGKEMVISKDGSKATIMVVPTDEELMIAKDVQALV